MAGFFQQFGVFGDPCQVRGELGNVIFDLLMSDGVEADCGMGFLGIGPEVVAVDGAVSEPDTAVVGVVLLFSADIGFHRPVADDVGA